MGNNHLCWPSEKQDPGFYWTSSADKPENTRCTQISAIPNHKEPDLVFAGRLWTDNFLCVSNENAGTYLFLLMNSASKPASLACMEWPATYESSDTGLNNYLCN